MAEAERNRDYDNFAWFYNRYWSDRLIEQIFWSIEKYLLNSLAPGSHILDLCCGNAHLTGRMIKMGFKVTGIDASEEMLHHARVNAPEAILFLRDARNFSFDGSFDAAVCTCDSLNHIMTIEELRRAFENVHHSLKPGGRFLFDLNTEEGYRKYWTGVSGGRSDSDNAYIVKLTYDEEKRQSLFETTMFRLIENRWQRFDARLTQQFYPRELVEAALNDAGFANIDFYDVEKDLGIEGTGRMMFVMSRG